MDTLIPIIIWAVIICFVFAKVNAQKAKPQKKRSTIETVVRESAAKGAQAASPQQAAKMTAQQLKQRAAQQKKVNEVSVQPAVYRKGTLSAAGIHDDRNDWLSQQLTEEKKAERLISAMFGLKLEHALDCPAEKIRDEHAANCDAEEVKRYSRK